MVEEQPPKRVVKRVVKKTVARPATPAETTAAETTAPMRYGRPVATATAPPATTKTKAKAAVATRPAKASGAAPARPAPRLRRPSIDIGASVGGARDGIGRAWWATADAVTDGARATGTFVAARARTVSAWRLPHLNAYLASAITGAVVGLVAVVLAVSALAIFEQVRGVASGGGLWGGLTFTAVAILSVFVGEAFLKGFGATAARLTSFLAVVLTIVAMLSLFLSLIDGAAGLVLVPLLGAAAYTAAHWLADLAENAPAVIE